MSCILDFLLSQNSISKKKAKVKDLSLLNIHTNSLFNIHTGSLLPGEACHTDSTCYKDQRTDSHFGLEMSRQVWYERWSQAKDRAAERDEREQIRYWGKIKKKNRLGPSDGAHGSACWGLWRHLQSTNLGYLDGGPIGEKPMEITGFFWVALWNNGKCREKTWVQVTVTPQLQEP